MSYQNMSMRYILSDLKKEIYFKHQLLTINYKMKDILFRFKTVQYSPKNLALTRILIIINITCRSVVGLHLYTHCIVH